MYVLIICDGWGLSPNTYGNAIFHANTRNMDSWMREYPFTILRACCESVGLPPEQMGNSEVGHLNIGAGRVVYSPLTRLNEAIENLEFQNNPVLLDAIGRAKEKGRPIHLVGMVSDGGVHSHLDHLMVLIAMSEKMGVRVVAHAILDGRDTLPREAERFLITLEERLRECGCGRIADISGRYFAMDRDKRWPRIKLAYDALVRGEGEKARNAVEGLRKAYARGEGDEFLRPTMICPDGDNPVVEDLIRNGDNVIFFNFRPDRARQLSHALTDREFGGFERDDVLVDLTTMMKYEDTINGKVAFPPVPLANVLGEVLSGNGMRQLRITETEKFAHVTFFLNGGREDPFPGEDRILVSSPRVATYDLQPEMSAPGIVERLVGVLDDYDVIIMNFANCDMVGHTGIFEAVVRAVEAVDRCTGKVVEAVLKRNGTVLITADHGNAEMTFEEDGNPHTAHTLNPVPFIWISKEAREFKGELLEGAIPDIAPTLLRLMGLPVPPEMTSPSIIPGEYFEKRNVLNDNSNGS